MSDMQTIFWTVIFGFTGLSLATTGGFWALFSYMDSQFHKLNIRMDGLDERLRAVESRVSRIEGKLDINKTSESSKRVLLPEQAEEKLIENVVERVVQVLERKQALG